MIFSLLAIKTIKNTTDMVINKYHTHGIFIVLDKLYNKLLGRIEKKPYLCKQLKQRYHVLHVTQSHTYIKGRTA